MSGIRLKEVAAATIPTPAAGTATVFLDVATGEPSYKDDAGAVTSLQGAAGTGFADGDYGDIVISGSVTAINLDSSVVTAAAKTVLDDATVAAMVDTLGGASATGTGGLVRAASPALTGSPTVPTQTPGDNSTKAASTAYADAIAALKASLTGATFSGDIVVPDEVYDATAWDGSMEAPTKNAVRDKIESVVAGAPAAHAASHETGGADAIDLTDQFQPLDADLTALAAITRTRGDLIVGGAADWAELALGAANKVAMSDGTDVVWSTPLESLIIAVGDETTAITVGAAKVTFRMPYAFTLVGLPRASLTTASSSGNPAIDINDGGVSIFSTTLTIDANEKTSTTATTPAVVSDSSLADDAEITIDIDTAGTGAAGLKVTLIGRRT
jgi:hypothetical protein